MAKYVWSKARQTWVTPEERAAEKAAEPSNRSSLPFPAIISDQLDDMRSMADGKIYDSKSNYYKALDEQGYAIDESKPDDWKAPSYEPDEKEIASDVAQTLREAGAIG